MTNKHIIEGCEFQSYCIEYKDISYLKIMPICAIHELSIACHDKENKCKYYKLYKQLKRKEEELQAQRNFTTQEQRKIYCVAYDKTCETGNECKQKECVFKDRLKYKQALDEIEEIAKHNNFLVRDPFCGPGYRDLSGQILNIINKARSSK